MKTILLVEDEQDFIDIIAKVFEDEGYDVKKSLSAEEALRVSANYLPDIIVCDVKMSEMDGFTMLEHIKRTEGLKEIPFVFVTAFDDSQGKKRAKDLGANVYITKPIDLDYLLRVVKGLVPG